MTVHYWLPRWAPMAAITILGHVFAKRDINPLDLGHEGVHVRQQRDDGLRFYWRYLFFPSWRVRYEAEAYAVQARAGCPITGANGLGAVLSGPLYGWPCSQLEAEEAIAAWVGKA